ncbi:metal ABC transporter substrate-binding protein, partial [Pseudomonas syringae pv. tagetis]
RGAVALNVIAFNSVAVIGERSFFSVDTLNRISRLSNLPIVELDAARPVEGWLAGFAVEGGHGGDGLYSLRWVGSNILGRFG